MIIDKFFTPDTMSVHLKREVPPMAKRGSVGNVQYVSIRDEPCTFEELCAISDEFSSMLESCDECFLEVDFEDAWVMQIGNMRITATNPPFSDDTEITVVRPIAQRSFEDYSLNDELKERILSQRGVLIAGAPGAGKSTFAAGVAHYLHNCGSVVKTMESPRDLQVPKAVTQYAPLCRSMANTADVLLLVRPDYTIYDEVRKTGDFEIFADMRLAGVGMIGVVHASRAIDAVQRLISRIELGVIPQVVDTVIFVDKGEVAQVLTLEFTVKIPAGMIEADLARPVIVVRDFVSGESHYEIYTYGEQVVVMPLAEQHVRGKDELLKVMKNYAKGPVDIEMAEDSSAIVRIAETDMAKVIGKGGKTISDIEKMLGMRINVRKIERGSKEHLPVIEQTKRHVILNVREAAGCDVDVHANDDYIFSATVGRHGDIKVRLDSDIADDILSAVHCGNVISVREAI